VVFGFSVVFFSDLFRRFFRAGIRYVIGIEMTRDVLELAFVP